MTTQCFSQGRSDIILSICIPTYDRSTSIVQLVRHLLSIPGNFEICIHVDGSSDDTEAQLQHISDARLTYKVSGNMGRSGALMSAIHMALGRFIMPFDDDDWCTKEGLEQVLKDCADLLPNGCAGYIYHMTEENGQRLGSAFPRERTNLLALRADFGVIGDKKEVVAAPLLRAVLPTYGDRYRRTPTSLLWARVALTHDIQCKEIAIGLKSYRSTGMSGRIARLKRESAAPQALQGLTQLQGFFRGRYRSKRFAARAAARFVYYGLIAAIQRMALWKA